PAAGPAPAGALFGLHPMLADSVAYVSGRTDVLCGIGVALALLGLLSWLGRLRRRSVVLVWVGTAVALLAKETALVLPVATIGGLLWARRGRLGRQDWAVAAGSVAVAAGYLVARAAVLGSATGVAPLTEPGSLLMLAANNAGRTVVLSVLPFWGRVFAWDGAALARPTPWLVPLAGLLAVGFFTSRGERAERKSVLWLAGVLLLLPASALAQYGPLGRAAYLPGIALAPLAALAVARLVAGRPRAARGVVAAAVLLAVVFVPLALRRMRVWRDGFGLFSRMTAEAPGYAAGHFNLAFELRRRDDADGAIAAYRRVIALDSTAGLAHSNLGALLQAKGRFAEAAEMYRTTVRLLPDYALARNNLGIVLYRLGDAEGAVRELGEALRLNPRDAGAAYNLARVLQRTGQTAAALESAERAAQLEPGNELYRATVRELREAAGSVGPP
ncbi:MAG: tetratricopeptide repeat protein, partial [bacterium]